MVNTPYSKDSVKKGILHYLLGRGFSGFAGFATVILLVRYMDVQSYAGFTALTGLIVFAGIISSLGLERVVSRYVPEARVQRSAKELALFIWHITFIKSLIAIIMCFVLFFAWHILTQVFKDISLLEFPFALACFVIAETLFQHYSSVFQSLVMQKALTKILVIQWAGRLIMIAMLLLVEQYISLEQSLWVMAIPEMCGVIVFILVLNRHLAELAKTHQESLALGDKTVWPDWSAITKMAANNYGFTLLAAPPQGYFMKMLAAAFLPTHMVAAYGFFISIAEKARQYIPMHLLYNLIEPVMIGAYLQDRDFATLKKRCQLLYKSNLMILIPAIAWVAAFGASIIAAMTGGKYQEYQWLLLIVILQLTVGSHVVLLQLILNSIGESALLIRAGVYALIGMAVFWACFMFVSTTLIVIGPLIFSVICNIYVIQCLQKNGYQYQFSWAMLMKLSMAGFVAFCIGKLALFEINQNNHPLLISLVGGLIIAIVYVSGLYFLKAVSIDEIRLLKSFTTRRAA